MRLVFIFNKLKRKPITLTILIMPNHDTGVHTILISMGIISDTHYTDEDMANDKKRNVNRPKYGTK